jgi:hypothetical protein
MATILIGAVVLQGVEGLLVGINYLFIFSEQIVSIYSANIQKISGCCRQMVGCV